MSGPYVTDCLDHSCILRDKAKPAGQRTQGGCRHLKERGPELNKQLRAMGAEIVRLRQIEAAARAYVLALSQHDAFCAERDLRKLVGQ